MTSNEMDGNDVIQQTSETELTNANGKPPRRPRKPRHKRGPRPSGNQQQEDGAPESPQETEEIGHKVFVGNLPFSITEEELFEYFTQAGQVLNASIVERYGRPRGYGFVTFENEDMANKAITLLNKTTCAERVINVETTKPRAERMPGSESQGSQRGGRGRFRGRGGRQQRTTRPTEGEEDVEQSNVAEVEDEQTVEGHAEVESSQRERARPKRRNRRRQAPPANDLPPKEPAIEEAPEPENAEASQPKRRVRKPRVRKPRDNNDEVPSERRPRRPRGPPSDTSLFVANLPFNMNDTGLEELFKDFKIASAHVISRKGSDRNKGFGFVELADHGEQQRVLDALEVTGPLNVDGRHLSVKVALQEHQEEGLGMAPEPARIDAE